MKLIYTYVLVAFTLVGLGSCGSTKVMYYSDVDQHQEAIVEHQKEMNEWFADSTRSPLPKDEVASFHHLPFFPIDATYQVVAELKLTPDAEPFEMPTTTDRLPVYRKYGEVCFNINGEDCKLSVYQNMGLTDPRYKDYLFLPFRDATSGVESYGGGRYLDLQIPKGTEIVIDFNRVYNPYCAYNDNYSCPIPPVENTLSIPIKAGVKAPEKH